MDKKHGKIISGTLKIGKNNPEISNLEFENHKNLNFSIFRRVVRARKKYIHTNII